MSDEITPEILLQLGCQTIHYNKNHKSGGWKEYWWPVYGDGTNPFRDSRLAVTFAGQHDGLMVWLVTPGERFGFIHAKTLAQLLTLRGLLTGGG